MVLCPSIHQVRLLCLTNHGACAHLYPVHPSTIPCTRFESSPKECAPSRTEGRTRGPKPVHSQKTRHLPWCARLLCVRHHVPFKFTLPSPTGHIIQFFKFKGLYVSAQRVLTYSYCMAYRLKCSLVAWFLVVGQGLSIQKRPCVVCPPHTVWHGLLHLQPSA